MADEDRTAVRDGDGAANERRHWVHLVLFSTAAGAPRAEADAAQGLADLLGQNRQRTLVARPDVAGRWRVLLANSFSARSGAGRLCSALRARGTDCHVARMATQRARRGIGMDEFAESRGRLAEGSG